MAAIALKEKSLEGTDIKGTAVASPHPAKKKGGPLSTLFKIIGFIILAFLFIRHPSLFLFFLFAGTGGRGGGSGGFGRGFGGFGGGLSGGGGASGSW